MSTELARRELESKSMGEPTDRRRPGIRPWTLLSVLATPAVLVLVLVQIADAQPRKPGATAPRNPGSSRVSAPRNDAGATPPGTLAAPTAAAVPASVAAAGGSSSDAGVVEAKTLDGGTHVFKFSELDIEGRLKSPQLVYFLRRVRAEFAAGELGHRTFMREMSETRKESTF